MSGTQTYIHVSDSGDAMTHLALEEVFLREGKGDLILLYINDPCVVIGKHQNAYAETNTAWCKEHNVPVFRRLSGGGTVFHDEGNINFCFIREMEAKDKMIDFGRFLKPIQDFLKTKGIEAVFSGRNDLLVDGYKISGNAEHVFQKRTRVIHHGTILVHSALVSLNAAIHPSGRVKYSSNAVQSVRSEVRNLNDMMDDKVKAGDLMHDLANWFREQTNTTTLSLDRYAAAIWDLIESKYSKEDWNYGYSPAYSAEIEISQNLALQLDVRKGTVQSAVYRDGPDEKELDEFVGKTHNAELMQSIGKLEMFSGTPFAAEPELYL